MIRILVVAIFLPALAMGGDLIEAIEPCSDTIPIPEGVRVDGCEFLPCSVKNGEIVRFEIDFTPPRPSETLKPKVSIVFGVLEIPFTIPSEDQDACNGLIGSSCPIAADTQITYGLGMEVSSPIVGITITLRFSLADSTGAEIVCYKSQQFVE